MKDIIREVKILRQSLEDDTFHVYCLDIEKRSYVKTPYGRFKGLMEEYSDRNVSPRILMTGYKSACDTWERRFELIKERFDSLLKGFILACEVIEKDTLAKRDIALQTITTKPEQVETVKEEVLQAVPTNQPEEDAPQYVEEGIVELMVPMPRTIVQNVKDRFAKKERNPNKPSTSIAIPEGVTAYCKQCKKDTKWTRVFKVPFGNRFSIRGRCVECDKYLFADSEKIVA